MRDERRRDYERQPEGNGQRRRHGHVIQRAIFYSVCTSVLGALVLLAFYKMMTEDAGFIVMFAIGGLFGLLLGYWAVQYLRDLSASLATAEGEVTQKWHRDSPVTFVILVGLVLLIMGIFRLVTGQALPLLVTLGVGVIALLASWRLLLPALADLSVTLAEKETASLPVKAASVMLGTFRPSFYIVVTDKIYAVSWREYMMLLENDLVRVTWYPHSLTVERLERYDTVEKQYIPATSGAAS